MAETALIVANNRGLWVGQLHADRVTVTTHVPQADGKGGPIPSELVRVEHRRLIRHLDADPQAGLSPALGGTGNLVCLDVERH